MPTVSRFRMNGTPSLTQLPPVQSSSTAKTRRKDPSPAASQGARSLPAPVSLEAERRRAMMLIHSVEKDVASFRETFFRKPKNPFSQASIDFAHYVLEKSTSPRRHAKTLSDFQACFEKGRDSASFLYPNEVLHADCVLARAAAFDELVESGQDRLKKALELVGLYCLSFSAEAGDAELRCVQEYENNIVRWRGVVRDSLTLFQDVVNSIRDCGPGWESYIDNYDKVLHYMHLTLEVFPRIYNPLKDWVTSDEAYPRKLQDEANDVMRHRVQLTEDTRKSLMKAEDMVTKVSRNQHQTNRLKDRLGRVMEQRRFCRRQEMILVDNAAKLKAEIAEKKQEMDEALQAYYMRRTNYSDTMHQKLVSTAASQQQEMARMEKRLHAIHLNQDKVHRERCSLQKEVHKLQVMCERSSKAGGLARQDVEGKTRALQDLQEENRMMAEKLAALRTIRAIKTNPATLKKIHTEGYSPGRRISVDDPFEEACKLAAGDIGKDWALLYNKLPFNPERDMVAKSHDIQAIDLSSQKNNSGLRGAAFRCLEKWRRLSNKASVSALVATLRAIKKQALANKIDKYINSHK